MAITGEQDVLESPTNQSGKEPDGRKGAQAVERVLNILDAFTAEEPELTATQLSQRLGLNKTTVHRLASVLQARGLLARDPKTRAYMLGYSLLRFVELVLSRKDVASISMPHMTRLRAATGETVGLHLKVSNERVCVAQLESSHELRMRLEIGKPLPLYCGAASKTFLAAMTAEEIGAVIEETKLKPLGPGSIKSKRALNANLEEILENGFAISREERIAGGITVAAPIHDNSGAVVASLSIYAPLMRASEQQVENWILHIKETAQSISAELGFRGK